MIPLKEIESVEKLVHQQSDKEKQMFLFEVCLGTDYESLVFVNQVKGHIQDAVDDIARKRQF